MKRDMSIIRELLLHLEKDENGLLGGRNKTAHDPLFKIEGQHPDTIHYHLLLLSDGGYLNLQWQNSTDFRYFGITWKGHDFLDSIRDPEIWKKTVGAAEHAGGWTIDLLGDIAKGLIKKKIKDHTGVEI